MEKRVQETAAALLGRYLRFCVVGSTGLCVDMSILWLLATLMGWNLSLSKAVAAEVAIWNNFLWNDLWTFRGLAENHCWARLVRLGKFNLICLAGVGVSVLLLNAQVRGLRMNLYAANLITIVLVSLWNYLLNLRLAWRT